LPTTSKLSMLQVMNEAPKSTVPKIVAPKIEVNEKLTRQVAHLARLELTDSETTTFTSQLGQILKYIEKLQEVPVDGPAGEIEPLTHPFELATPYRPDEVRAAPKVLQCAPEVLEGGYKVPQVL